jgi:DNA-binding NarL/FixJ family response regulator
MKIVIVDDDEVMRKLLRAICEGEGHEVTADFADGRGLLDYVSNHHPDVVCLDYELPGENGLGLLVNMDVSANHVDVVMITASDDPELKGHAADLGAAGFIHKPFKESQVVDELREIVKTRAIAAKAATMPEAAEPMEVPKPAVTAAASTATTVSEVLKDETVSATPALAMPLPPTPQKTVGVVPRSAVIVDDSGSIRLLLKGILEEIGIKVIGTAANGRQGVDVVEKTHPALVCLDVDMPGMTGLEALPHIRAISPQTKVIMITGNAGRQVVQASIAGGAKGYFLKPIRPAKVEEFMRKLLAI